MPGIRISPFGGMVPKMAARLLPAMSAQIATNCKLEDGELVPLRHPKIHTIPDKAGPWQTFYRMWNTAGTVWLTWTGDVDVVDSPVDTTDTRTLYTGDGEPRVTNWTLATASTLYPASAYVLGVFPPSTAPSVSAASGVSTTYIDRTFVYTFVATWPDGTTEESAPSPASTIINARIDDTYTVSSMQSNPPNSGTVSAAASDTPSNGYVRVTVNSVFGLRAGEEIAFASVGGMTELNGTWDIVSLDTTSNYVVVALDASNAYTTGGTWARVANHNTGSMTKNIYWSESGSLFLVKTGVSGTSTTVAGTATTSKPDWDLLTTWDMPPTNMHSIGRLPNGVCFGVSGKSLCFSDAFRPYAWPERYRQQFDQDIIAAKPFGNTVGVASASFCGLSTGTTPDSMQQAQWTIPAPCLSKRGAASIGSGMIYPSNRGMVLLDENGPRYMTEELYTELEWEPLQPDTMNTVVANGKIYISHAITGSDQKEILILRGAELTSAMMACDGLRSDEQTGALFISDAEGIKEWDSPDMSNMTLDWYGKVHQFTPMTLFTAAKVDNITQYTPAEESALATEILAVEASNAAIITAGDAHGYYGGAAFGEMAFGESDIQVPPDSVFGSANFTLYADGESKYTKALTSTKAFRLPTGYKADNVAIRIQSNMRVRAVQLANNMNGLKMA